MRGACHAETNAVYSASPAGVVSRPWRDLDRQRNSRSRPRRASSPPRRRRVPVGTVAAERKPVSRASDFVGRVEAINRVQMRARVTGFLEAVLFKEGDTIKENAPVYQLEKGQFEAAVKQAEGALERSQGGQGADRGAAAARARICSKRSSGTEVARDQALAADQQAAGSILEAEANLQTAKINLGYTDITSPDHRQDRPHQRHQGQRGRSRHRRADHDRQPGPDVRDVPGEPARFPARAADRQPAEPAGPQGQAPLFRRHRLRRDRHAQFRRRVGRPQHRHRDGARDRAQPEGRPDRRSVDAGRGRGRQAGGEDRHSAVGADRRSAGHLRLRGRGRQGRGQARQGRAGPRHRRRDRGGPDRRRAGHRPGPAGGPSGRAGAGDARARKCPGES